MVNYETSEREVSACPCGKGKVIRSFHTPDNAWSRNYTTYGLACPECNAKFVVEREHIYSRSEHEAMEAASEKGIAARIKVDQLAASYVDAYFKQFEDKPKTEQLRQMSLLKVATAHLDRFRKERRQGTPFSRLANPTNNPKWLLSIVSDEEKKKQIAELLSKIDEAKEEEEKAKTAMISIRVPTT
ncbi:hypothetical protein E0H72_21800 [Rhizobium leguminosarum bv. viciae]|uniref:hypothetical protein n=1 Tax=Rhizobium leguminosarum TaxID=384 RepID=UPI00103BDB8D|nr:hypothetical protein [Rhizobium leguminosarum]TCA40085.1 hypothetical protein E0H72_21800 [Rhizobium leguminosarum bv. viciae]